MKINLNKKELEKLNDLFETDEKNKLVADFLMFYIDNAKSFTSKDIFYEMIEKFQLDNKFVKLLKEYNLDKNIKQLDVNQYLENEYYKNIKLNNITLDDYKFKVETFKPFEGFLYKKIDTIDINKEITSIGYFDKDYEYITLSYQDNIWMLISPHEINTMKESIDKANGKVITFGLGLGFFAYMVSLKENVNKVTIVEKDDKIIELFNKFILPQFKYKDKIEIIKDDALNFIQHSSFDYDYAFVDLWRDVDDGLELYYKIYSYSKKMKTEFSFWIEESMIIMLRRCLITLLYETLNNIKCDVIESFYDVMISKFDTVLKDYVINSFDDITYLLSDNGIKKLIEKSSR